MGQAIVDLGFLTDRQIAAEQYDLEFVSFAATPPEPDAVQRLPEELARRYAALPARVLEARNRRPPQPARRATASS